MASHRVRSRKSDSEPGSKREISKRGGSTSGSTSGGGNEDHPRMTARRSTTSVFSVFSTAQIQELKETFTLIDQNQDGFIDIEDLRSINMSMGLSPDDASLKSMLAEAPGPINFTMFLTLFGEKTKGTDPENTLRDAFAMFDSSKSGVLDEQYVKDLLMNTGDPFSKEEIKQTWKEVPIESGKLDYIKFVQYIKRGKEEEM